MSDWNNSHDLNQMYERDLANAAENFLADESDADEVSEDIYDLDVPDLLARLAVLEQQVMDARAALAPLANLDLTKTLAGKTDDYPLFGLNGSMITVGDVRQARAVMERARGEQP